MNYFSVNEAIPLPIYRGEVEPKSRIAVAGDFLYLLTPRKNKMLKIHMECMCVQVVDLCRPYYAICYDPQCACFWAIGNDRSYLYQLDECLIEIGVIDFRTITCQYGNMVDISLARIDTLFLCFPNVIVEVTKFPPLQVCIARRFQECGLIGITNCEAGYGLLEYRPSQSNFYGYSANHSLAFQCTLPIGFSIHAITTSSLPCRDIIWMLASVDQETFYLLKGFLCSLDLPAVPCRHTDCTKGTCCSCQSSEQADNDLVESVAMQQAALSHILNAEGEKIQKVVCCSDNVCDMLEVNDSVNNTISSVIRLEEILLQKLKHVKKKRGVSNEEHC